MLTAEIAQKIMQWQELRKQLVEVAKLVSAEMSLRKEIFASLFPNPAEGTNRVDLTDGFKIKGVYKLNRKLDEAALPAVLEVLRTKGVKDAELIRYKPELVTACYKNLPADCKSIFDEVLTTSPASPELEIEPPKVKK